MKRIICVLLACALLIVPAVRPARATGTGATIGIVGGAIGTGGAAGGIAAGSVLLPVLGVVGVVLAAYGINVALSDASQEAGLTKTQYIYSKIGEFADFAGLNVDAMVQGISQNVKVSPTGNIILDAAGGAVISQFIDWLFSSDSVSAPVIGDMVSVVRPVSGLPDPFRYYTDSGGGVRILYFNYSVPPECRIAIIGTYYKPGWYNYSVILSSPVPGNYSYTNTKTGKVESSGALQKTSSGGVEFYWARTATGHGNVTVEWAEANNYDWYPVNSDQSYNVAFNLVAGSAPDVLDGFQGDDTAWTDNKDLLKPGEDNTISINPDLLNPVIENAAAGDYTATVPDYLTALAHVLDRADAGEVSLPVTNVATGAAVPLAVPSTAAAAPAITNVAATSPDVVGAGALADPAIPISPADAVPGLQFDLTEIFPFCIPFDLVDMITLLSADPVTPRFHLAWTFPIINAPVEFDVDLSQFDGIAAIVRPFELLIFVIGLALVTRDLIRG